MLDPVAANTIPRPATATNPTLGNADAGDFQTFLTMLTTQMQNQNPLEPTEASDFAAQLATFSGVEQQVQTNKLLESLAGRMGLSELGSWVGRDVLSAAPIRYDGTAMRLVPPEVEGANRAEMVVTDSSGREVGRYQIDPDSREITFEVPDASTPMVRDAFYTFTMVSYRDDTQLGENPILGYSNVQEARTDSGRTLLVLDGGHLIDSSDVVGLRDPTTE